MNTFRLIAPTVLVAGVAALAWQAALQPLPIVLPKPLFEGTPEDLKAPNLEKPLGRPRPPFLAPAGTENVAKGKPVTSSDPQPAIGEVEFINDGEKSGLDGTYVQLGPGLQSVTIDLKQKHAIYAILFWHYQKQARVYNDVVVSVADDPDFITGVRTLFNNDHDNSSGLGLGKDLNYIDTAEGKLVDGKGVEARYVRLYSNGNNANALNHYVEVEVFGKPVP
jgi:hypothetical protein